MLSDLFHTHASHQSTGTILLMYSDMSLGKIYFSDGQPVSARYLGKEGQDAIELMRERDAHSSAFHNNIDAVRSRIPVAQEEDVAKKSIAPAFNASAEAVELETAITMASLTSAQIEQISNSLAHFIGPVAHIMVSQQDPASLVSDTIAHYIKSIADPRAGRIFKSEVDKIMQSKEEESN